MQQFLLDGVAYNVNVTKLSREFSIMDAEGSGRTQNGEMYRDVVGTFYNYSMTVEPRDEIYYYLQPDMALCATIAASGSFVHAISHSGTRAANASTRATAFS